MASGEGSGQPRTVASPAGGGLCEPVLQHQVLLAQFLKLARQVGRTLYRRTVERFQVVKETATAARYLRRPLLTRDASAAGPPSLAERRQVLWQSMQGMRAASA